MRFDIWRNFFTRQWYFRIVALNGEIIAWGEGYRNHDDCRGTVDLISGGRKNEIRELGTVVRAPKVRL